MKAFRDNGGHDTATIGSLSLVSAKPGQITTRLPLAKHNMNRLGSLHGGLICTLVDTMGSLALASKGLYSTGVSTDIHTTFVKAAGGVGEEVLVMGQVTSLGECEDYEHCIVSQSPLISLTCFIGSIHTQARH